LVFDIGLFGLFRVVRSAYFSRGLGWVTESGLMAMSYVCPYYEWGGP